MSVSSTTPGPWSCKALTALGASNQITLQPGGSGNSLTLTCTNPSASRTITLPDPGAAASFILSAATAAQTINSELVDVMPAGGAQVLRLRLSSYASSYATGIQFSDNSGAKYWQMGQAVGGGLSSDFYLYQQGAGGAGQCFALSGTGAMSSLHNTLDDASGNMSVSGTLGSVLTLNSTAGSPQIQIQSGGVAKAYFGYNSANGVTLYNGNAASILYQSSNAASALSLRTTNNILDDGSGNATFTSTSSQNVVTLNAPSGVPVYMHMLANSVSKAYYGWDPTNGMRIYDDVNNQFWLQQGGTTAGVVESKNNTLDDGGGGASFGTSGSNALNLATGSYSGTLSLGNASSTLAALGILNLGTSGSAAVNIATGSYSGTLSLGNASSTLAALGILNLGTSGSGTTTIGNASALVKFGASAVTPVAVNTTALGTSALPFTSVCLGTSNTAYGIKKIVQVTLSQSQIVSMFNTPVQVAATPGAGLAIFVQTCVVNYVAGTAAFATGGPIVVQYGNTTAGGGVSATNSANVAGAGLLTAGTTNKYVVAIGVNDAASGTGTATSGIINTGIFISNQSSAFNNAGSGATLVVTLEYLIVPMS